MAVCIVLGLFAAWTILASSGALDSIFRQKDKKGRTVSTAAFNSNSPSKEYIYGGGRLVATEEPSSGGGCTPPAAPALTTSVVNSVITLNWNIPAGTDTFDVERTPKLSQQKAKLPFYLYAYCLMPNHVHLLIEMRDDLVSRVMQPVLTSYSQYHNRKYKKIGHLFQGRYKSIRCQTDRYLGELVRYIHLNPVRARMVKGPEDFEYSVLSSGRRPRAGKRRVREGDKTSGGEYRAQRQILDDTSVEDLLSAAERSSGLTRQEMCSKSKNRRTVAVKKAVIAVGREQGIRNRELAEALGIDASAVTRRVEAVRARAAESTDLIRLRKALRSKARSK